MNNMIELHKGGTYFFAVFFDRDLTVPSIETYIYEGYDKTDGHLFLDAYSYLQKKNGENVSEGGYLCFPEGEIDGILNKEKLIEWLQEEHSPQLVAPSYEYKII